MNLSKFSVCFPKIISLSTRCYSCKVHCDELPKHVITTLIGAATPIGRMTSLLLKQDPNINELRLYDTNEELCGVVHDLSHIDTNTKIKGYIGTKVLPHALKGAHIILVCSGKQRTNPQETQLDLLKMNTYEICQLAFHAAEINPKAVFCLATPPINALVPLVSAEYKKANVYDPRKIIGITTAVNSRANSIIARKLKIGADCVVCPIIGGYCPRSTVPVLSQVIPSTISPCDTKDLIRTIKSAENDVLKESNGEGLVYSPAFGIANFTAALAKAIKGQDGATLCLYVRQTGHVRHFLKYMISVVKLGRNGIESVHMPRITIQECLHLQEAAKYIRKSIELGEVHVVGEEVLARKMIFKTDKPSDSSETTKKKPKKEPVVKEEKPIRSHNLYTRCSNNTQEK